MICPICQVGTMVKGVCNWCGAPTQVTELPPNPHRLLHTGTLIKYEQPSYESMGWLDGAYAPWHR